MCKTDRVPTKDKSKKPQFFGITKKGTPCKKCINKGGFCYLHVSQMHCSKVKEEAPPKVEKQEPKQNNAHNEEPASCQVCIRLGKSCIYHEFQSAQGGKIFGITQKGEPCKKCIAKGDFCYYHYDQKDRQNAFEEKYKSQKSQQHPFKIFGLTVKNKPCEMCLYKGDFCAHHETQRARGVIDVVELSPVSKPEKTFGVTLQNKPCKRCTRKGDFCYQHEGQRDQSATTNSEGSIAQEQNSQPVNLLGITKKGQPCKLCIRNGDFCHHHKIQKQGKVGRCQQTLSLGCRLRRTFSLLFFAVVSQCLIFTSLNEGSQSKALEFLTEQGQSIKDLVIHSHAFEKFNSSSYLNELFSPGNETDSGDFRLRNQGKFFSRDSVLWTS